jgi:hypothetical protein
MENVEQINQQILSLTKALAAQKEQKKRRAKKKEGSKNL